MEQVAVCPVALSCHYGVLDPKLTFFTDEVGSIWVDITVLKTIGAGAVLIWDRLWSAPSWFRIGVWCDIAATQICF
jgi:hypothetical protein